MINKQTKLAVDRYSYPPTDNQVVVPKFHKQKMTLWTRKWPQNSFTWPWYPRHMKDVMIHDTPSYDNTATHQLSFKSMTKDKKLQP